jgi:hypothetical protein
MRLAAEQSGGTVQGLARGQDHHRAGAEREAPTGLLARCVRVLEEQRPGGS